MGDRGVFGLKGTTDARTVGSCLAGRFGFFSLTAQSIWMLNQPTRARCSGEPAICTHQGLWNQAPAFPKTPVIAGAQYLTFLCIVWGHGQFFTRQYWCADEEVYNSHWISLCRFQQVLFLQWKRTCCFSPPPSPRTLMMPHISCSWSSLSCSATMSWTSAALTCELLLTAGQRQIPRNANICKENAELVQLHIFVWADILCYELEQELLEVLTKWSPPTWHFTLLNHCSQTRPAVCTAVQISVSPLSLVSVSSLSLGHLKFINCSFWVFWVSKIKGKKGKIFPSFMELSRNCLFLVLSDSWDVRERLNCFVETCSHLSGLHLATLPSEQKTVVIAL